MCRASEALLYWQLASELNALRRRNSPVRDVVDALLDIRGLSLLADAPGIRRRCESLTIPPAQASLDTTFFFITGIYDWPEPATYVPIDWRCPDALA